MPGTSTSTSTRATGTGATMPTHSTYGPLRCVPKAMGNLVIRVKRVHRSQGGYDTETYIFFGYHPVTSVCNHNPSKTR